MKIHLALPHRARYVLNTPRLSARTLPIDNDYSRTIVRETYRRLRRDHGLTASSARSVVFRMAIATSVLP